jgi:uncharacterized protein
MNLHVKLVDVDPAGGSHIVLYGQRAVENPGDGTAAEVYLRHTGYRLPAGHRLRLQVASSDYPCTWRTRGRPRVRGLRPPRPSTTSAC